MISPRREPVTFGQLSVLRSLVPIGPAGQHHANLVHVCELPDDIGGAQVADAWSELVRANESLRTTYDCDQPEPVQIIQLHRPRRLEVVELTADNATAARAVARDWARQPFTIATGPPWQCFVGTYNAMPRFLAFVVHHAAADHGGCLALQAQLDELLAHDVAPVPAQPTELAHAQRANEAFHQETLEYWAGVWPQLVDEDRHGNDDSPRQRAAIYTEAGMHAAQQVAQRLRVSVQAVVLGVSALVLLRSRRRHRVTLGLMAANRSHRRWEHLVTSMNQLVPITIEAVAGTVTDEFLRDVHVRSLTGYLHGSYHVDRLREHLQAGGRSGPDPIRFDHYFNFLGEYDDVPAGDSVLATGIEWRSLERRVGPRFNLTVATGAGMHLVARASQSFMDRRSLAHLLAGIESGLVSLAQGAPAIDDVDDRPLRQLP